MEKMEIIFNPKDGSFVVHYSGVATHEREHALTNRLITELRKLGFDVDVSNHHDQPRIPEVEKEDAAVIRTRIRGD